MSRGPGKIERDLETLLRSNPDGAFTTDELAERIYGVAVAEKKHLVAVGRALRNLLKRDQGLAAVWVSEWQRLRALYGVGPRVYYNWRSVMSYALMHLKAYDTAYRDPYADKRGWWDKREHPATNDESELLAMLAPGGKYHGHVQPGGEWHADVADNIEAVEAKRSGDTATLARIAAAREQRKEARVAAFIKRYDEAHGRR